MKNLNKDKIIKNISIVLIIILLLVIFIFISLNLIVDPIIFWLASTERSRILISCILSWIIVSKLFDLYYQIYIYKKKSKKFNALKVPYPRKFQGRTK